MVHYRFHNPTLKISLYHYHLLGTFKNKLKEGKSSLYLNTTHRGLETFFTVRDKEMNFFFSEERAYCGQLLSCMFVHATFVVNSSIQ